MKLRHFVMPAACVLAACSTAAGAGGTIRVGIDPDNEPFEYTEFSSRRLAGFNIDLWTEIARRTGREAEFVEIAPGKFTASLERCWIDAAALPVEETKKAVFSAPWLESGFSLIVPAGDVRDYSAAGSLESLKIAVKEGTPAASLAARSGAAGVRAARSLREALLQVKKGRADAALVDSCAAAYFGKHARDVLDGLEIRGGLEGAVRTAPAVAAGRRKLLDEISSALEGMKSDGFFQEVFDTWFREGYTPEPGVTFGPGLSLF